MSNFDNLVIPSPDEYADWIFGEFALLNVIERKVI